MATNNIENHKHLKVLVFLYTKDLCHSPPTSFPDRKKRKHISMTHAFLYSYFKNLYFLCLLSVNNKISSEFQSLLEAVLLMEGNQNCIDSCIRNTLCTLHFSSFFDHKFTTFTTTLTSVYLKYSIIVIRIESFLHHYDINLNSHLYQDFFNSSI